MAFVVFYILFGDVYIFMVVISGWPAKNLNPWQCVRPRRGRRVSAWSWC